MEKEKHTAKQVKLEIDSFARPEEVEGKKRFFKVCPGGYSENDVFMGVTNGDLRKISKRYINLDFSQIEKLLSSEVHEYRQIGLFILVLRFERACKKNSYDQAEQKAVYDFYLKRLEAVNNWDLVDSSAHYIIGAFLLEKEDRSVIYELADSGDLWRERVAVISTFAFIRNNDFSDILKLAEKFLCHEHDLIHKAVGWMLREVGKRDCSAEEKFLRRNYLQMPRTMLRYAIEKFSEDLRQKYLKSKI
jgi:3-methyladenine DNA glycosylase AlkD